MKTNDAGVALVELSEGTRLRAYKDGGGVWTIGTGHTTAGGSPRVVPGMVITKAEAEKILRNDLKVAEDGVARMVKVPLNENQHAALVSFTFNLGEGQVSRSTLLRKLNRGDYKSVPGEMMKWVYDNGKRIRGLEVRRRREGALWSTPVSGKKETSTRPLTAPEKAVQKETLLSIFLKFLRMIFK